MDPTTLQNATAKLGLEYESVRQFILFGFVGGVGTVVNTAILFLLHTLGGLHYLLAAAIATETAIISNFIGNQVFTFDDAENDKSLSHKFLLFQGVSMFTLVGTLLILWTLTTLFGVELVLVWNLVAIVTMFLANFALNKRYTWGGAKVARKVVGVLAVAALALLLIPSTLAVSVTVSEAGYHPDSAKRVVVYGATQEGGFALKQGSAAVYEGELVASTCQGGQACLVGDFSEFQEPGNYQVSTVHGASPYFTIKEDRYAKLLSVLGPYFNAQQQRGSDYHPDLHASLGAYFTDTADGSFLMEADQASVTLARLGSAYRRNPAALDKEHVAAIERYADYLLTLQGTGVVEDEGNIRLDPQFHIENAFVVGPTSLTAYDVYGEDGKKVLTTDVISICTDGNATDQACADHAARFYACEAGEVCLNQTYGGRVGALQQTNSLAVPKGWAYEFGCYFDVGDVDFSKDPNPCMIFQEETSPAYTERALLALLESYPALVDNGGNAQAVLTRAEATAAFLKDTPASDAGAYGASLFLLYDYTQDPSYLQAAHAERGRVSQDLKTGLTTMNEFYWEEYVRHKDALNAAGLPYAVGGKNPEEIFTGKLLYDRDHAFSGGENVYVLGSTDFSHSRPILIEGVIAAKTAEMGVDLQYPFITGIADDQISWLTGQNAVQQGVTAGDLASYSFIFGVGTNPEVFHSRLYMTTGYARASKGAVIGARETDFQTRSGTSLDGRFGILGYELGTVGEQVYDTTQSLDGHSYIPGWINGAHDTNGDGVWNYEDGFHSYTFTETTNEMVAAATELAAYQDARKNGRAPHPLVAVSAINETPVPPVDDNQTDDNQTDDNQTGTPPAGDLNITVSPQQATYPETAKLTFRTESLNASSYAWTVTYRCRLNGQVKTCRQALTTTAPVLEWTPGILHAGEFNPVTTTVTVTAAQKTGSVQVAVADAINPFFLQSSDGPEENTLQVLVQKSQPRPSTVVAVFSDGESLPLTFEEDKSASAQEYYWRGTRGFPEGVTTLTAIRIGIGNQTQTYAADLANYQTLQHYHKPPTKSVSSGGGRSGPSLPPPFRPSLVYTLFEDDVIGINDSQMVTLDMRSFENEVAAVMVVVEDVNGNNVTADLELVDGDGSYGTWRGALEGFEPGQHTLRAVVAGNYFGRTYAFEDVEGGFYVIDSTVAGGENLGLVYATLDKSRVENGTPVVIRLDARDAVGIMNITAIVTSNRGDRQLVQLERIEGDEHYGTYEGLFEVRQPDSTYELSSITLTNHNETVTREVEGRSVYVRPLPGTTPTGLAAAQGPLGFSSFEEALDHPLAPAAIGLAILVLAVVAVFTKDAVIGLFRRDH